MKQTLGLSMIVGPNDAVELNRLLTSFDCKKAFDQIVIAVTTQDKDVMAVASRFGETLLHPWTSERYPFGNFALARDASLERITTDYWMWLDADDMLSKDSDAAFLKLREGIEDNEFDFGVLPYVLQVGDNGRPTAIIQRERVFRRESNIHWRYPIHEQLTIDQAEHRKADLLGLEVYHLPTKPTHASTARNLQILEHEYYKMPDDHIRFYFARDLWSDAATKLSAIPILVDFINHATGAEACLYEAAALLADCYMYRNDKDLYSTIRSETLSLAEKYIHIALTCGEGYAEPLVFLGDLYNTTGDMQAAERCFKAAMHKKPVNGSLQHSVYYEEIPANRIMRLCHEQKRAEEALWYAKIALEHRPDNKEALDIRREVVEKLYADIHQA